MTTTISPEIQNEMRAIFADSGYPVESGELAERVESGELDCGPEADITQDAFEHYVNGLAWRNASRREMRDTIDGHKYVYWSRAQARKGDQRVSVLVVDLGDYRAIMQQ